MTKNDVKFIADVIASLPAASCSKTLVIVAFTKALIHAKTRFNSDKFMAACMGLK
jgi:hypothetical protein